MRKGLIGRYPHFQYLSLIKANVIGLDQLKARIQNATKETQTLVDAELEAAAMNFVGLAKKDLASQGGDRGTLLRSITYNGKEVDRVAFLIARSIYKNGISPKPFFFKQITPVRNNLVQNVTRVLDGI